MEKSTGETCPTCDELACTHHVGRRDLVIITECVEENGDWLDYSFGAEGAGRGDLSREAVHRRHRLEPTVQHRLFEVAEEAGARNGGGARH